MKYRVYASMTVDVEVIVEAESKDDAWDIVEQCVTGETYSNETVGVEYDDDDDLIEEVSVNACGDPIVDFIEEA